MGKEKKLFCECIRSKLYKLLNQEDVYCSKIFLHTHKLFNNSKMLNKSGLIYR